ncbi:MAG: RHS repeat-associated core domain-containing protein, partial [Flavobacterium sp.]|nr:RHS repeat-associated core domain-containing protein [Flavobacterium sp.]
LNEVKYTYGAPTDAFAADQNAIGRLLYQEDATGVQVFGYGQMGEITKNLRSVAVAGYQSYWFFTTWKYDSWNRIHKITYPDQEIVSYRYNKGGALEAMSRSFASGNDNLSIVDSITYNDYGERTAILYGNGTRTSYSYDTRRRMNALTHNFTNFQITKNYGYDVLSNITSITTDQPQNSLPVANQIGGPVNHTYQYDEFNRIIHATGNYTGYDDLNTAHLVQNYELNMEYNLDHTIKKKTQIQTRGLANVYGSPPVNTVPVYKNSYILDYTDYAKGAFATGSGYGYQQPHAPRTITESPSWVNGLTTEDPRIRKKEVSYDANGNQTEIKEKVGELKTSLRKNLWDEENRLMAVNLKPDDVNNHPIAVYTYSGNERVVRYNFDILTAYSNGTKIGEGSKDNIMIYPSGFITGKVYHSSDQTKINRMTYTRHYYIGSQRIGSSTGNTKANDMGWYPLDLITTHMSGFNSTETRTASNTTVTDAGTTINTIYTKFGLTPPPLDPIVENTMANYSYDPDNIDAYYFHPDHLGSSSYISNAGGTVSQHMEYLPFGETLVDEHINSISSPFKFNGKEKDEETGNYYYGARYYDPKLSMFISVDPLAEKTGDAYGYCDNNPINLIDPDGMEGIDPGKYFKKLWTAVKQTIKDDFSSYKRQKFDKDVTQPVVKALRKSEKMLNGSGDKNEGKQGGYDMSSDFKKGAPVADTKRKGGGRDIEIVDVTGLDAVGGLSSGLTNKSTKSFSEIVVKYKDGIYIGNDINEIKEELETISYREATGTATKTGINIIPDHINKEMTVLKKDALEIYNKLQKKFEEESEAAKDKVR